MRTTEENHITLHYPDEIGFAFNPVRILVEDDTQGGLSYIKVSLGDPDERVTISTHRVDFMGNKCADDVQAFIQSYFAGLTLDEPNYSANNDVAAVRKSNLARTIDFSVACYDASDVLIQRFDFEIFVVWGAIIPGGKDIYNGFRKATWFANYPFTIGIFAESGAQILYAKNGRLGGVNDMSGFDEKSVYNITPALKYAEGDTFTLYDYNGEIKQATFDNSFDLTFYMSGGVMSKVFEVNIDRVHAEGTYLRWIDRHGFFCYWLFKDGDEKRKVVADTQLNRNDLFAYDDIYGYHGTNGRRANYSREDTYSASAPLVDRDTFDFLQGVTTSPVVDMYCGKDANGLDRWQGVSISTGTYTKERKKNLQDFVINITLPTINIQKL